MAKPNSTTNPLRNEVKVNPADLIGLALMEAELRKTNRAIKGYRQRIAAGMPAGAKLTLTPTDIRRLVGEYNKHCAKRSAGIPIPTWLFNADIKAVRV